MSIEHVSDLLRPLPTAAISFLKLFNFCDIAISFSAPRSQGSENENYEKDLSLNVKPSLDSEILFPLDGVDESAILEDDDHSEEDLSDTDGRFPLSSTYSRLGWFFSVCTLLDLSY